MSHYLRTIRFETDFDGDHVTVEMRPIKLIDMLKMEQLAGKGVTVRELGDLFREVVPPYVDSLTGLKDAAGADIEKDLVFQDSYFARLMMDIGKRLMQTGAPGNPRPPVAPSAEASAG